VAGACRPFNGGKEKSVPLIQCESCGKSSFAFARRAYVAHCSGCGEPLTGRQDTSAIESEIRERLYGPGSGRPRASNRGRVEDLAAAVAEVDE
jgi:ribosomal protein S27E